MPPCRTISRPVIVNIFLMMGWIQHTYTAAVSTVKMAMACSPIIVLMPEIQPFYIYPPDDDEEHLCPVCAMAKWIDTSQVTSGFMF